LDDQIASLSARFDLLASRSDLFGDSRSDLGSLFASIIDMFKSSYEIIFEKGLLKVATIITDKLTAKEICLEEICVNKAQLQTLLEKNGIIATPTPTPTPEATPEPTPVSEVEPLADQGSTLTEPTPEPTPTPEPSPSETPTPTPEIAPEATPTPSETPLP